MDIPAPEMILLIGIPASGKSTFYRQKFSETHLQISLDILHSRAREMEVLQATLAAGKSCVIDNTNVTPVFSSDSCTLFEDIRQTGVHNG